MCKHYDFYKLPYILSEAQASKQHSFIAFLGSGFEILMKTDQLHAFSW